MFALPILPLKQKLLVGLLTVVGLSVGVLVFSFLTTPMTTTVTGIGQVQVPATSLSFDVSVAEVDADVSGTITVVKAKVASLKTYLVTLGVNESDIVESQVVVTPASALVAGVSGYRVMQTFSVKVPYSVVESDQLVVTLYQKGATIVSQPVVSTENQEKLEAEALDKALKQADDQAASLQWKQKRLVRKVVDVQQASSGNASSTVSSGAVGSQTPGQTGMFSLAKGVSVTYRMW